MGALASLKQFTERKHDTSSNCVEQVGLITVRNNAGRVANALAGAGYVGDFELETEMPGPVLVWQEMVDAQRACDVDLAQGGECKDGGGDIPSDSRSPGAVEVECAAIAEVAQPP